MNFWRACSRALGKSFRISGRSLRSEWWYFTLIFPLFFLLAFNFGVVYAAFLDAYLLDGLPWDDAVEYSRSSESGWGVLEILFTLALFTPLVTVSVRRLHDIGRSGLWVLAPLTLIGTIPFFYWMIKPGDEGENTYGPDPRDSI